jgi:hypothetical protein
MSCFWNLEISWGSCEAEGVRDWLQRVLGIVVRKMLVSAETAREEIIRVTWSNSKNGSRAKLC